MNTCVYQKVQISFFLYIYIYDLRHISLNESCFLLLHPQLDFSTLTHFAYGAYPAHSVQGKTMFLILLKVS